MSVEYGEFNGRKTIVLVGEGASSKYPFSFGRVKAKLVVENFEEIKKFAEENDG